MAKMQQPLPARMPRSASGSRIGPAVAEAHKVFNFGKCFIALEELLAYAPDDSSNVYPITVFAAPSDEAFVVDPIVDRQVTQRPAFAVKRWTMLYSTRARPTSMSFQ